MPARPTLFVTRRLPEAVERRLCSAYRVTLNQEDRDLNRAELAAALANYDAICPAITDRLDADLLGKAGRRIRIIANFGAGLDHIDLDAARAAGLAVTNTPGALTEATAELAILLMLIAARRAGEGERELRAGQWTGWRPVHLLGQGLAGKRLGLVGFGRIARATAIRARALGMTILYHSRTPAPPEVETALAARRAPSLRTLAEQADVLSLHVPGGPETRHLIDASLLSAMKPTSILVNTARGSVVDEAALAEALATRRIGYAALDVYEAEPAVRPALLESAYTVLLPHLGSATIEARTAMGMQVADNLDAFFAGDPPPDRVV